MKEGLIFLAGAAAAIAALIVYGRVREDYCRGCGSAAGLPHNNKCPDFPARRSKQKWATPTITVYKNKEEAEAALKPSNRSQLR